MSMDIRMPMGLMFTALGLVLTIYGAFWHPAIELSKSLGINVNLWWGFVILAFGLTMLGLCLMARRTVPIAAIDSPTNE